jgi:TPR repeat protein
MSHPGTRLSLSGALGARKGVDDLAAAAREAAGTRYELLGELGRDDKMGVAMLARDRELDALVTILLTRDGGSLFEKGAFAATVLPEIGEDVPLRDMECPVCSVEITTWARLCANCWSDNSGVVASDEPQNAAAELLAEARKVARGAYTIIGHLTRSDGGGAVYFGRAMANGHVTAFRLIERTGSAASESGGRTLSPIRELKPIEMSADGASEPSVAATSRTKRGTPRASVRYDPTPVRGWTVPASVREWRPTRLQLFGAATVVIVASSLLALTLGSGEAEVSPATDDSVRDTVTAPSSPSALASSDSAQLLIAGSLPEGSRVTLNGIILTGRRLVLAPGVYFLAVTAPGFEPVDYRLSVAAGDQKVWTPVLNPMTDPRPTGIIERSSAPSRTDATAPPRTTAPTTAPARSTRGSCDVLFAAKRWSAAAQQCAREAEQGNAQAQANVGFLYLHGRAAPQNDELAANWFHRAASKGHRAARYQLGLLTESGRGVPRSTSQAADLFLAAARQGEPNAQMKIGRAYERGSGVGRDRAEAAKWYRAAIERGNAEARNYLGMMFIEGKDIARDSVRGAQLVRSAAERGVLEGQANLGMLLAKGHGMARNESEAALWLKRAADRGHKDAAKALRDLERRK